MAEKVDVHRCKRCGAPIAENARFCVECGAPVDPAPREVPPAGPPVPTRRRGLVGATVGGAAVLLLAAGWFFAGGQGLFAGAGRWTFSSNEDGIQALYFRGGFSRDGASLFRLACNTEDGVVWMNSQALSSADVDKRASERHRLDISLSGAGRTVTLEGYATQAPEGASASWEAPRSPQLMAILAASDLAISGPSLDVRAGDGVALSAFAQACPPVPVADDAYGWSTSTSLPNGYRIDIPRKFFRIIWGDRFGRAYESGQGNASLLVMSQVNALEQGLAQALKDGVGGMPALDTETYRHVTRESAVVSGLSGGTIVYFKARSTCGNANIVSFTLTYDAAARATFDPIAARMSKSFDAKTLPDGRPLCP
ncbi:MAG: zinc ribbon domain-containing protein [Enhydrobacter sp.]